LVELDYKGHENVVSGEKHENFFGQNEEKERERERERERKRERERERERAIMTCGSTTLSVGQCSLLDVY